MAIFESPHVYIRNPAIVREKIQKLIDNGADKLQVNIHLKNGEIEKFYTCL